MSVLAIVVTQGATVITDDGSSSPTAPFTGLIVGAAVTLSTTSPLDSYEWFTTSPAGGGGLAGHDAELSDPTLVFSAPGVCSITQTATGATMWVDVALPSTGTAPGPRHALDAATTHAWYCDETSGTTLANAVTGAANPVTLSGTYALGDVSLYGRETKALRCFAAADSDAGHVAGVTAWPSATAFTLEAVVQLSGLRVGSSFAVLAEVSTDNRSHAMNIAVGDDGKLYAIIKQASTFTSAVMPLAAHSGRLHVAAVYQDSTSVVLYVNGVLVALTTIGGAFGVPLTDVWLGNYFGGTSPFCGVVSDVRVTPAALGAAYMRAATVAMGAL